MSTNPPPSRRQFLSGSFAAGDAPQVETEASTYFVVYARRAMACEFEVRAPAHREQSIAAAAMSALDEVESIERRITVYHDASEVSHLNRAAPYEPQRVGPDLLSLLKLAGRLHEVTAGAYDITSGPLSRVWGFSKRAGRLPSDEDVAAALQLVGWHRVAIDDARSTVAFAMPGVEVNFNSMGKGYALDQSALLIEQEAASESSPDFLLHGGRSTLLARGQASDNGAGWPVGLRHPLRPRERMVEFRLRDEALSTSGSGTQFFRHRGKRYGHLLDPRTGWPAEGIYSATVVADSGVLADALSTALYVMGPEAALDYCDQHPDVKALLVVPTEHTGQVELLTANLTDDDFRVLA